MTARYWQRLCWTAFSTALVSFGQATVEAEDWAVSNWELPSVVPVSCSDASCSDNRGLVSGTLVGTAGNMCAPLNCDICRPRGCSLLSGGCSDDCDAGCDSWCGARGGRGGLCGLGIVKPSERCFDDFISPMTNPVFFEDPRTLTEVRLTFVNHRLPTALGGQSVQAYAPQFRVALSERLSLIATKGSYIDSQNPLIGSGYLDLAGGFKYNLLRDPNAGRILSFGTTFEAPSGSRDSLQGNGDGEFHFFLTGGTRILGSKRAHWLSSLGLRQPLNENAENRIMHWSNHFDYRLGHRPVYAFTEFNWWNYLSSGTAFPMPLEGGDIFNFGAPGVTGNDLVTQAVGLRSKFRRNVEAGVAYEFPLTSREGIMRDRLALDLIVRY